MKLPDAKTVLPYTIVAVVCLFGGAAIGWGLKPEKVRVEEKLKTVEVEKQVVVVQEKVRVEVVKVKEAQVSDRYRREKTQSPDGTIREVEERNIDSVVKEKENTVEVKVVEVEKQVVVEKQVDRIVKIDPVLKNWHIGVEGGVDLPTIVPVVGVDAERRIAGPFWLGIWGQTNTQFNRGAVGLKVAVEF